MRASSIFVAASFVWLLISFWNRNDLPGSIDYLPQLSNEPVQVATKKRPFDANYEGVRYQVEPQFEYELYGMVVSYRHHDGDSRMHLRSNDHLNMLDVCVIWGDNTINPYLNKIDFWNALPAPTQLPAHLNARPCEQDNLLPVLSTLRQGIAAGELDKLLMDAKKTRPRPKRKGARS